MSTNYFVLLWCQVINVSSAFPVNDCNPSGTGFFIGVVGLFNNNNKNTNISYLQCHSELHHTVLLISESFDVQVHRAFPQTEFVHKYYPNSLQYLLVQDHNVNLYVACRYLNSKDPECHSLVHYLQTHKRLRIWRLLVICFRKCQLTRMIYKEIKDVYYMWL
ncbi:hypothetical protein PHYBLDRAFT_69990 [Phycomyces blakesleeanus NRRL 1555(-)]|uniref:Uncharacterized protein n=1 Tax=Phycomyces blakesleeanus (strain ATCC 8743b / DSM 1359 / FGSC 10004 / NBRC 33097 / NRRL 1555) TaxID=763407 RepID=A0A163DJF9_PHYB8|nr:hypothetical protein PHYBLDRAFT_69990 [Phycomyces blakesleeanus NRRL 1555(-)]OAD71670.1 hypothetical protein PHYBLDRAFT_69990 [Phycomyces blakesleeanus NRRL 1555(-)]|eukprot:XP_018289710.1 hypothetical protein PHYBLDRAFT_69990 [Phycomyces blakesleeanus NRRL 1555(-)]